MINNLIERSESGRIVKVMLLTLSGSTGGALEDLIFAYLSLASARGSREFAWFEFELILGEPSSPSDKMFPIKWFSFIIIAPKASFLKPSWNLHIDYKNSVKQSFD